MVRVARSVLGAACLLAAFVAGPAGADDCYTYEDSMIVYYQGVVLCGGSGSGCTECVDGSGGSCVTNGESCHIKNRTQ